MGVWSRSKPLAAALVLLVAAAGGAGAGETPPAAAPPAPAEPPAKNDTVHGFGTSNPECLAWSNGCVTCARDEKSVVHCSTPGIACLPAEVTCKVSR